MSDIVEEVYLVKVDSNANNNKFYKMSLYSDDRLVKTWGRVGSSGQTTSDRSGRQGMQRAIREKTRKGYAETRILSAAADSGGRNGSRMDNNRLATIAADALSATKDSQSVADLIRRISLLNQHEILEASGGKIKVDTDGVVKTALGIVDEANVKEARRLLTELDRKHPPIDRRLLDQYLMLIPQKVPGKAGWADDFFTEFTSTKDQFRLLDQLEDSIAWYKNQAAMAKKSESSDGEEEAADYSDFFRYRIREASGAEFAKIKKKYDSDKNSHHTSARLRPLRAFALVANNAEDEQKWAEARDSYGNVKNFWHGTSGSNLLSIFRRGMLIPPTAGTTIKIAGRMFGPGIYLSNQSSKSLNYSTGYWHSSKEASAFMFLTETVMGSEYRPAVRHYDATIPHKARTEKNKFGKPYNSISVKGGYAGVMNHEAIVWNTEQVALRYLVEFGV